MSNHGRPANAIYKWKEWFRRKRFILRKGKEYQVTDVAMNQMVRNEASRRGLSVTIVPGECTIAVIVNGPSKKALQQANDLIKDAECLPSSRKKGGRTHGCLQG